MIWFRVTPSLPRQFATVLLYREGDLYPVVGSRFDVSLGQWMLEEGGAEDDEARCYPFLNWTPTHWASVPETP